MSNNGVNGFDVTRGIFVDGAGAPVSHDVLVRYTEAYLESVETAARRAAEHPDRIVLDDYGQEIFSWPVQERNARALRGKLREYSMPGARMPVNTGTALSPSRVYEIFYQEAFGVDANQGADLADDEKARRRARISEAREILGIWMWTNERIAHVFGQVDLADGAGALVERMKDCFNTEDRDWVPCCENRETLAGRLFDLAYK